MSITFQVEQLVDVWPELIMLHKAHWGETEAYRHNQPFAPLLARYMEYECVNSFVMYTIRDGDKLVGNLGMYFTPSMHTQLLLASEDTLFILPEYRRGRLAIDFIKYVEADCVRRGVSDIEVTAKNDKVGRLMMHLDYQPTAVQYSKQLSRADSASPPLAVTETSSDVQMPIST